MKNKAKANLVTAINLVGLAADVGSVIIPHPAVQTLCKGASIASHALTAGIFLKNKRGIVTMPALISAFFSTNNNEMVPYLSAVVHAYNAFEGRNEFKDTPKV